MRFDMRAPAGGAAPADLYPAALEMCAWAETRGCLSVVICEPHGSPDGYLPAPLIMSAAVAARTEQLPIMAAAVLLPFYDPVRLAEEMNILDILSRGRVSFVFGLGYRPEEFEHFGVERSKRGKIAEDNFRLLVELRTGAVVLYEGRRIHITPPPFTVGGPPMYWGGKSIAAAKRAGRFGLGLVAQAAVPGMQEAYAAESRAHGHEPGPTILPPPDAPSVVFVADDVDQAWDEIGPHLLHDATTYASWNPDDEVTTMIQPVATVDDLRHHAGYRIMSTAEADEAVARGDPLLLAPLCGGIPPSIAWRYLTTAASVSERSRAR
jgi:alkanesulfonate monooxygenase SsuD/methylene tetrahydromethanopterin reductase-like flavin-dependent oxidoreductase (luciferase family)